MAHLCARGARGQVACSKHCQVVRHARVLRLGTAKCCQQPGSSCHQSSAAVTCCTVRAAAPAAPGLPLPISKTVTL